MTIAPLRVRPLTFHRNPVLTRSQLAMAQFTGEPQLFATPEGTSTSVPLTFTLTPSVPLVTPGFHPLVFGTPLHSAGHWHTYAPLDPITESILVTTTRIPETLLTASSPQGSVTFDTLSTAATSAVGSLPSGQSVSLPLGFGPSPTLHLSIPTNGPPDVQYQHLMELAQVFRGMALSVRPSLVPTALEVPVDTPF